MNGIGTHQARRRRGWSSTWMVARRLASIAQVDPPVDRHVDPPVDRHVDPGWTATWTPRWTSRRGPGG